MRVLLLIVLGAIAALGLLRAIELLSVAHNFQQAIFPLAIGVICAALFAKQWKKPQSGENRN